MLLTLLAGNLNPPPRTIIVETVVPIIGDAPTIYAESRRDLTSPLLFWRNVLAETEVGTGLFRASYRLPEEEVRHTRTDHQLYFQIARQAPAAVSQALWMFTTSYRLLDVEPDYARANHQAFFQFVQPGVIPVPPVV